MRRWFREGFYGGLAAAILFALFLVWLWRPEHQIRKHTDNLLHAVAHKDWARFGDFLAEDYRDQWNNDRAAVMERTREVFRYVRNVRITQIVPNVRIAERTAYWQGQIVIDGDSNEVMAIIKERINNLGAPFELEWCRQSAKPWDWKLVAVRNEKLQIPENYWQ
jgi:hypothetical protein